MNKNLHRKMVLKCRKSALKNGIEMAQHVMVKLEYTTKTISKCLAIN